MAQIVPCFTLASSTRWPDEVISSPSESRLVIGSQRHGSGWTVGRRAFSLLVREASGVPT